MEGILVEVPPLRPFPFATRRAMRAPNCFKPLLLTAFLAAALPACNRGGETESTPSATTAAKDEFPAVSRIDLTPKAIPVKAKAVMESTWGGKKINKTIHGAVVEAAKERGELDAMSACDHTGLASEIQKLKGVTAGRSSLRLRNPKNAGPEWVQKFLRDEGEKSEVNLKSITEIVEVDGGQTAHFLRRIPVQKGCLGCHGAKSEMDPKVVAFLAEKYPEDKAVGYAEGELRGVAWAEIRVEAPRVKE